jgi:diguanylate cyclase (GGDEF)-like protein
MIPNRLPELSEDTRIRVMRPLALLAVVVFIPLVAQNIWNGHYLLATSTVLVLTLLAANFVWLNRRGKPVIPHEIIALPTFVGAIAAIGVHGMFGAFWTFPIILYGHFVLRRKIALFANMGIWAGTSLTALAQVGPSAASRVSVALLLTIVIINIVINVLAHTQEQLTLQSITDPMTGAFNRRHMESVLERAASQSARTGMAHSLLLIDIDHFKDINDFHGHASGDETLRQLTALVLARVRAVDLWFRVGGEEFLLLAPDTRIGDALGLAETLRREVMGANWPNGHPVTISAGVAEFTHGETWEAWLQRADLALYRAKHGGRNLVVG